MSSPSSPSSFIIPTRFRGPARSGNGGWAAGSLAHAAYGVPRGAVEVRLRMPPPLETTLAVTEGGTEHEGWTLLRDGEDLVAQAREVDRDLTPVAPVPLAAAREAEASYPGLRTHPFPTCFVCGTGADDGLRIFPGHVGEGRVASSWTAGSTLPRHEGDEDGAEDDHVSVAAAWAALDCVGGWTSDLVERPMVLGTYTVRVDALPRVGDDHVVVGEARGVEGRKTFTASSLYDADGRLLAVAEHLWVTIDPSAFN